MVYFIFEILEPKTRNRSENAAYAFLSAYTHTNTSTRAHGTDAKRGSECEREKETAKMVTIKSIENDVDWKLILTGAH